MKNMVAEMLGYVAVTLDDIPPSKRDAVLRGEAALKAAGEKKVTFYLKPDGSFTAMGEPHTSRNLRRKSR